MRLTALGVGNLSRIGSNQSDTLVVWQTRVECEHQPTGWREHQPRFHLVLEQGVLSISLASILCFHYFVSSFFFPPSYPARRFEKRFNHAAHFANEPFDNCLTIP